MREAPIQIRTNKARRVYALMFVEGPGYLVVAGGLATGSETKPLFLESLEKAEKQMETEVSC